GDYAEDGPAAAGHAAATAELRPAAVEQFFETRRAAALSRSVAPGWLSPWPAAGVAAAATRVVVPGHSSPFGRREVRAYIGGGPRGINAAQLRHFFVVTASCCCSRPTPA